MQNSGAEIICSYTIVLICNIAQLFIAVIYIRNPNLYMCPSRKHNCKTDRNGN